MFNSSEYPQSDDEFDGGKDLVLGTRFRSVRPCTIIAFRYFKAEGEKGPKKGYIYSADGSRIATTERFSDDICPGPRWVQVPLTKPVRPVPGREFVVAVDTVKYYAKTSGYFPSDKNGDLVPIGGFFQTESGTIPTFGEGSTNYWVDGKLTYVFDLILPAPICNALPSLPVLAVVCRPDPTVPPTVRPTRQPTREPTRPPTRPPTREPTRPPTRPPTREPTRPPTAVSDDSMHVYCDGGRW
jgi:hypothetical protein